MGCPRLVVMVYWFSWRYVNKGWRLLLKGSLNNSRMIVGCFLLWILLLVLSNNSFRLYEDLSDERERIILLQWTRKAFQHGMAMELAV
ncbi:Uncharacterized protein TCM_019067 [Theobroma cacao]|uniref:Uncharacterized protein n=1 Tax=Theobroma cacao TaxID=3641 RepID=A0A061EFR9_THECC|nr:Uncharacterized protein TCM_019067 [Theobroma cacao]